MERYPVRKQIVMMGLLSLMVLPAAALSQTAPAFIDADQSVSETKCINTGLAVSGNDAVFLTGHFAGRMILGDKAVDGTDLASQIFLAKFDEFGKIAWLNSAGGTGEDYSQGVAVDSGGNSIITGYFAGTATFGATNLTTTAGKDMFVAKYGPSGALAWAIQAATATGGDAQGMAVGVDSSDNIYVTGLISGTSFGGQLNIAFPYDMFLAKYNAGGTLQWVKSGGSLAGWEEGLALDIDSSDNIYVAGRIIGTNVVTFSPFQVTGVGGDDVIVARYDTSGAADWVKRVGSTGNETVNGITADGAGNVYVAGSFGGSFPFAETTLTSAGGTDAFLLKYSDQGTNATEVTGISKGASGDDTGRGVVATGSGSALLLGSFKNTVDFGGTSLESKGGSDLFIAEYGSDSTLKLALSGGGTGEDTALKGRFIGDALLVSGTFNSVAFLGDNSVASVSRYGDMFVAAVGEPKSALGENIPGDYTSDGRVTLSDVLGILRVLSNSAP